MGDSSKRGHNPDMSGASGVGKVVKFRDACDYVKQPGGAYGGKSGQQPFKARKQNYTPDSSAPKR